MIMKRISENRIKFVLILFLFLAGSCRKQDEFLNVKNRKSNVTPETIADYQAVLDNTNLMNLSISMRGFMGSDNIYLTDVNYNAADQLVRNTYRWAKDIYQGNAAVDWNNPYQVIMYCNIVLEGLSKIAGPDSESNAFKNVRGSALFYRSFAFIRLLSLFAVPYSEANKTAPGIPLRLGTDITVKSTRAPLEDCYNRVIHDLEEAELLLPQTPSVRTRPCAVAANALQARIYLNMGNYNAAYERSAKALLVNPALLNFNTLVAGNANPFPTFSTGNPEVIFYCQSSTDQTTLVGSGGLSRMDTDLMTKYKNGDLRKTHFYLADGTTGLFRFKGSYTANTSGFGGLATHELYLIRAEAALRTGKLTDALNDLNTLLRARFIPANFQPVTGNDPEVLLRLILEERRKEMPFSGYARWDDLRRLNPDARFAITLTRTIAGTTYTIPPNDNRYVLPIPDAEIQMSGIPQNPR